MIIMSFISYNCASNLLLVVIMSAAQDIFDHIAETLVVKDNCQTVPCSHMILIC